MTDQPENGEFPLRTFLDFALDTPEAGRCVASISITDEHLNPNGVVHGGVIFTMVDTAMGRATMTGLADGVLCASIEVQVRFLRSATAGELRADTRVIRQGRRIVQLESRVLGTDDVLIATAAGSFAVLSDPSNEPPDR